MSTPNIDKVFESIHMLYRVIWIYHHAPYSIVVHFEFREILAKKFLGDSSGVNDDVKCIGCGPRTTWNGSHIHWINPPPFPFHIILSFQIWGISSFSGHMLGYIYDVKVHC